MEKHNNKCKFADKEGQALLRQLLSHRNLGPRALYQLKAGKLPALRENYFRRCPCGLCHFIPLISASLAVLIQDYDAQLENSAITSLLLNAKGNKRQENQGSGKCFPFSFKKGMKRKHIIVGKSTDSRAPFFSFEFWLKYLITVWSWLIILTQFSNLSSGDNKIINLIGLLCRLNKCKRLWNSAQYHPSVHWKDWCWSWNSNTLATWCEELTHLKRPWCWERLRAGGGDDRGWDSWMASPTQWTWDWLHSRSWWWTGKPGVLQSMGLQRIGHPWTTELTDWLTTPVSNV